jgi:4'-phosphopantetheinyl transferase
MRTTWSIENKEVHVWQAYVDVETLREVENLGSLCAEEQTRADRFRFAKDRDLYLVGRSMMRAVVGGYLGRQPHEIRFTHSPYGKPGLPADFGTDLRFNLSHSHKLALLAVTRGNEIGVDIEFMRASAMEGNIADTVFSSQELVTFNSLSPELKQRGFFNGWTRKEAFIKAKGQGLSMALDQFDVSLDPSQSARLVSIRPDATELDRWSLRDLELSDGYVGAIVVGTQDWHLKRYTWPIPR